MALTISNTTTGLVAPDQPVDVFTATTNTQLKKVYIKHDLTTAWQSDAQVAAPAGALVTRKAYTYGGFDYSPCVWPVSATVALVIALDTRLGDGYIADATDSKGLCTAQLVEQLPDGGYRTGSPVYLKLCDDKSYVKPSYGHNGIQAVPLADGRFYLQGRYSSQSRDYIVSVDVATLTLSIEYSAAPSTCRVMADAHVAVVPIVEGTGWLQLRGSGNGAQYAVVRYDPAGPTITKGAVKTLTNDLNPWASGRAVRAVKANAQRNQFALLYPTSASYKQFIHFDYDDSDESITVVHDYMDSANPDSSNAQYADMVSLSAGDTFQYIALAVARNTSSNYRYTKAYVARNQLISPVSTSSNLYYSANNNLGRVALQRAASDAVLIQSQYGRVYLLDSGSGPLSVRACTQLLSISNSDFWSDNQASGWSLGDGLIFAQCTGQGVNWSDANLTAAEPNDRLATVQIATADHQLSVPERVPLLGGIDNELIRYDEYRDCWAVASGANRLDFYKAGAHYGWCYLDLEDASNVYSAPCLSSFDFDAQGRLYCCLAWGDGYSTAGQSSVQLYCYDIPDLVTAHRAMLLGGRRLESDSNARANRQFRVKVNRQRGLVYALGWSWYSSAYHYCLSYTGTWTDAAADSWAGQGGSMSTHTVSSTTSGYRLGSADFMIDPQTDHLHLLYSNSSRYPRYRELSATLSQIRDETGITSAQDDLAYGAQSVWYQCGAQRISALHVPGWGYRVMTDQQDSAAAESSTHGFTADVALSGQGSYNREVASVLSCSGPLLTLLALHSGDGAPDSVKRTLSTADLTAQASYAPRVGSSVLSHYAPPLALGCTPPFYRHDDGDAVVQQEIVPPVESTSVGLALQTADGGSLTLVRDVPLAQGDVGIYAESLLLGTGDRLQLTQGDRRALTAIVTTMEV